MSQRDPTDIRSQERANDQLDERERRAAQLWVADLRWLMSDKRGRRIAGRLLDKAALDRAVVDTSASSMAFKDGIRWLGIWLKREIEEHCFDRYLDMLKEHRE